MAFRFLSPTKLNMNEIAVYSGRRIFNPYALFEALKVRDSKRLEPVQRYRYYENPRRDTQ